MLLTRRDRFVFVGLVVFGLLVFILEAADHLWFISGLGLGIAATGAVLRFGVHHRMSRLQFASYMALTGLLLMFISLFAGLLALFILSTLMLVVALLAALWRTLRLNRLAHAHS